ncbi:HD domain-containing phosphohydrolase [Alteromonas sp. ASW11-130]|uniref:HD domain-containing phosphohydrolase n=1 Tax=Alteromonas sp. ASW11-130 TaxID=3015775 RepID=UPI002241EDB8|nr:HD domain-containing phosphohydrolase [Alteromonas sp. ASW11-130]MCW8092706.1 HD domain-containing protein [Alteromonas sp. ASW11-130]
MADIQVPFNEDTALDHLVNICIRISSESNSHKLLEEILINSIKVASADAGSIYSVTPEKNLRFDTVINKTLGLHMGGSSGEEVSFPEIPIYKGGKPNKKAVVADAVVTGNVINIRNVYDELPYDMSAARKMDEHTGYHTQSMLTIPLKDHTGDIIGVLQLINAQEDGCNVPFTRPIEKLVRSFASLGAIALTNKSLVLEMEALFESFARTIAKAIDEKSPHTGGHCKRVPELTLMIADAVHEADTGPLADFKLTGNERHQLMVAGWLHDCGKVATPERVIEKATKLHTIFDRIAYVDAKLEIVSRDIDLDIMQRKLAMVQNDDLSALAALEQERAQRHAELNNEREIIKASNMGSEYLSDEAVDVIKTVASKYKISVNNRVQAVLSDDEVKNLCVRAGTLTFEEREIIKRHMEVTMDILDSLPFPKHLDQVSEYALCHHETLDGKGYPRGLTKAEMSVPARVMAVADIFEALSASDRPYKKAKPVSECLFIMGKMVESKKIDPDIFRIFVEAKVYEDYIRQHADPSQLDEIDFSAIPGLN